MSLVVGFIRILLIPCVCVLFFVAFPVLATESPGNNGSDPKYYTFEGTISGFAHDADLENSEIYVGAEVSYTVLIDQGSLGTVESTNGSETTGHYYARFVSGSLLDPAIVDPEVDLTDVTRSFFGIYNSGEGNGFIDNRIDSGGVELHLIEIYGMGDLDLLVPGVTVSFYERYKKQPGIHEPRYQASLTLTQISPDDSPNPIPVSIDIKPGSFPNSINLNSQGATPVAILGSSEFDVNDVDIDTITIGTAGIKTVGKHDKQLCDIADVSGDFSVDPAGEADGFTDLICHFITISIIPEEGGTTAVLKGSLIDGSPIQGVDLVNVVP